MLHVDLVTVGLNPGDGFASRDWANFHTAAKSNDHVLGEALRGTPAWGAYMTDLLPAVIETRSALVNPEQGALTELIAEVTAAGNADPVFLAFGTKVRAILADAPSIIGRPVRMIPLTHYSGAARGAVTKEYERRFGPSGLRQVRRAGPGPDRRRVGRDDLSLHHRVVIPCRPVRFLPCLAIRDVTLSPWGSRDGGC